MAKGGAKSSNGYFHWFYFCFIYRDVNARRVHTDRMGRSTLGKGNLHSSDTRLEKILAKASLTPCPVLRAAKQIKKLIDYRLLEIFRPFNVLH